MVYGLLRALPGDRAFLSPSPLRSLLLTSLTPASRRQNHTTSPSAPGALVFSTVGVHRIPSRVRDDREPPLCGTGRCQYELICYFGKSEYFCQRALTEGSKNSPGDLPVGSPELFVSPHITRDLRAKYQDDATRTISDAEYDAALQRHRGAVSAIRGINVAMAVWLPG